MSESAGLKGPAVATLIGGAGLLIGSFMSWVTVTSAFGEQSIDGIDEDGKITAVCGAIIALVLLTTMTTRRVGVWVVCALAALAGGATAVYDWSQLNDRIDNVSTEYARAKIGAGLYLCIAGAVVALVASLMGRGQDSGARAQPLPPPMA